MFDSLDDLEEYDMSNDLDDHTCIFTSECCGYTSSLKEDGLCPECGNDTVFICECGAEFNAYPIVSNIPTNRQPKCICSRCTLRVGV